ncbi:pyruvate kinase [Paenibacillus albicereus]|uniref:Pyruvate kinase n=1 Tax=Paenibacillus albicereus TaxID=2726185 RepID=A0A6H2GWP6_9BACL|nr:pyruvate kinase [Paenibacillus albicereus]QJC51558.1 pyruvate kinase [Paenibacillus albicereus]
MTLRKTKIVCTLGPASESPEVLVQLIEAGMNVARINMAHGELEDHAGRIRAVREACRVSGAVVPVLMDIKGPEVRIGKLKEPYVTLVPGGELTLTTVELEGDASRISVNYAGLPDDVSEGSTILIDDGLIELSVLESGGTDIRCRIISGGALKPRKGVNLPGVRTRLPGVTERDVKHIGFGIREQVDIIAASFVRKAEDIMEIRQILEEQGAGHIQIISKIENDEGVENLDAIIEVSDGIMVARGDLGVEIPVEDVPALQEEMIHKCNLAGKPVIVATHMLESMQVNPRPTRAEVSDVANAVIQGTDCIMLSGETAAGKYPVESVRRMASIAAKTESLADHRVQFRTRQVLHATTTTEVISQAAVGSSLDLDAKAILTPTESGFTARMVSKYRPKAPIIAITPEPTTIAKLCLLRGVIPVLGERAESTDAMFESAVDGGRQTGLLQDGDFVVISSGVPVGKAGATNLIKIMQV